MASDPGGPGLKLAPRSAPDPATVRGWLLDLAGVAFIVAAIYVGLFRGPSDPAFAAFVGLSGAYLGVKS